MVNESREVIVMARNEANVSRMPERTGRGVPVSGPGTVGSLRNEINHLFDRFAGRERGLREPLDPFDRVLAREPLFAQADLSETDEAWELQVDLPGMRKDDVTVDYANGVITIAGERTDEREDSRKGYYLSERSHGAFQRAFRVPEGVEPDAIRARFDDGVLTVTLPKSAEARRQSHRIEIQG